MKLVPYPFLLKTHLYCAAFIMPVALMFLGTGFLLFALDLEGGYYQQQYSLSLKQPLEQDIPALKSLVLLEMENLKLEPARGWTRIRPHASRPVFQFELHDGVDRIIELAPTENPLVATMTIKTASLYRKLVMLHQAQGNNYFRLYASVFALILLAMLVTGYLLAWKLKQHRKKLFVSSTASVLLFVMMLSIQ